MDQIIKGIKLSFTSLFEILNFTFSKDTSLYDKKVTDIIFSDNENKQKLMKALDNNAIDSIEIRINGNNKIDIVEIKNEVLVE